MVAGSRGTSSGRDCWITRKRARSCPSSWSLMTLSPTLTSVFAIQVRKVYSFIFFILLHTDMDASHLRLHLVTILRCQVVIDVCNIITPVEKAGLELITLLLERRIRRHFPKYCIKLEEGTGEHIREMLFNSSLECLPTKGKWGVKVGLNINCI